MKLWFTIPLSLLAFFAATQKAHAQHNNCGTCPAARSCPSSTATADTSKPAEIAYQKLPEPGKQVAIGDNYYFIYKFDKTPKVGVAVLKVQVHSNIKKGARVKDFEITGISDMPSMKGAHHAEGQFKLNRLGDYLLPVIFTAKGDWEVRLILRKDGKPLYYGLIAVKV